MEAPIPYSATAETRLPWEGLPEGVRGLVEGRLGSPVVAARSATAGFTAGFASRLHTADGGRAFVKAESTTRNLVIADCYRREAVVNAALPDGVPAPTLRWAADDGEWIVLCFEDVAGRTPEWHHPGDPDRVFTLATELADHLATPPSDLELTQFADDNADWLSHWRRVAGSGGGGVEGLGVPLDVLADLEAEAPAATSGNAMIHCDLRLDNVLLGDDGRGWVCDWNWPCLAAPWLDLVLLLPPAFDAGIDTDAVLVRYPIGRLADPDAVDTVLAALAGGFLSSAAQPPPPLASPWIRRHQRYYGEATLAWLAARLRSRGGRF